MSKLGILGFGHFGRALGEVLSDNEQEFVAFDPGINIPEVHGVASLQAFAQQATIIVVAVPVPVIESALIELRPFLTELLPLLLRPCVKSTCLCFRQIPPLLPLYC